MCKGVIVLKGNWQYEIIRLNYPIVILGCISNEPIEIFDEDAINTISIPKGSQPRCRYCKRRLVFHNNGEGADCLQQLKMDL